MLTIYYKEKPFTWSFSKLKNYATCPKRYHHVDVLKDFKEEESEVLTYGNFVHKSFASRLARPDTDGHISELPRGLEQYEPLMQKLERVPGQRYVEQKLALTDQFEACKFFDKQAWLRMVADVIVISDRVALAVDFKLGKILEDSQQLALLSACIFAHWPHVEAIRTEYWWLKDDAVSRADWKRADMPGVWSAVWPRIEELKRAHETNTFPAKPSGLCKRYCPVTSCSHHGVGA
jgi:hypothetical protein